MKNVVNTKVLLISFCVIKESKDKFLLTAKGLSYEQNTVD
jgi:hypothetical protein